MPSSNLLIFDLAALRAPLFKRASAVDSDASVVVQQGHSCRLATLAAAPGDTVSALQLVEEAFAVTQAPWAKAVLAIAEEEAHPTRGAATDDATPPTPPRLNIVLEVFGVDADDASAPFVRLDLPAAGASQLLLPPKCAPYGVLSHAGVAAQLEGAKRVLVMCGAGISVAAGISDFRTPGVGLYSRLDKYDLPEPEDLFTLDFLEERPEVFYQVSNEMHLWPGTFAPTLTHHFVKLLADRGQLLRCYTQNIDGLERAAGLDPALLVEAHGSFAGATCIGKTCKTPMPLAEVRRIADAGDVPRCAKCRAVVKPDVVFFGEALPDRFHELLRADVGAADMLLVIGTSLAVYPFAAIVGMVRHGAPRTLINMEPAGDFRNTTAMANAGATIAQRDVFLGGDCQATVQVLAAALGSGDALKAAHAAGLEAIAAEHAKQAAAEAAATAAETESL